jgi:dienelactone hydrolase
MMFATAHVSCWVCPVAAAILLTAVSSNAADSERVAFRSADKAATPLVGYLLRPQGAGPFPALVLLHGCGGLFDRKGELGRRHTDWADRFTKAGYVVLFPDSFQPRGVRSICSARDRVVNPSGRAKDALGAAAWLSEQPFVAPGRIGVLGWSNGGSTVLRVVTERDAAKAFVAAVALYPGCRTLSRRTEWEPHIPLEIHIGEADDWTPISFCREVVAKSKNGSVRMVSYPGAYHAFDTPDLPVRQRRGVAFSERNDGVVHVGTNEPARQSAIPAIMQFFSKHLGGRER